MPFFNGCGLAKFLRALSLSGMRFRLVSALVTLCLSDLCHGAEVKREFTIQRHYLNFPIKNGAAKRKTRIFVDGREIVQNDIELADGQADWWAFMDVSAWRGKTLTIALNGLPASSTAL